MEVAVPMKTLSFFVILLLLCIITVTSVTATQFVERQTIPYPSSTDNGGIDGIGVVIAVHANVTSELLMNVTKDVACDGTTVYLRDAAGTMLSMGTFVGETAVLNGTNGVTLLGGTNYRVEVVGGSYFAYESTDLSNGTTLDWVGGSAAGADVSWMKLANIASLGMDDGFGIAPTNYTVSTCRNLNAPGNYTLTNNITSGGNCLNIEANNVNIDCAGNSLTETGSGYLICGAVNGRTCNLHLPPFQNASVRNCIINSGGDIGVAYDTAGNMDLGTVIIANSTFTNYVYGADIDGQVSAIIENNSFNDGLYAVLISGKGHPFVIRHNRFTNNTNGLQNNIFTYDNSVLVADNLFNNSPMNYNTINVMMAWNESLGVGNFYTNSMGGYSDTCAFDNATGICTTPHFDGVNTDYLPLAAWWNTPGVCTPSWSCSVYGACVNGTENCTAVADANSCGTPFTGNLSAYDSACSGSTISTGVSGILQLFAVEIALLLLIGVLDSMWKYKSPEVEKYFHYIYIALIIVAVASLLGMAIFAHP
jgi:hypothetical protein